MLRLWGKKTSANVQKVLWTLAELGLEYSYEGFRQDFPEGRDSSYAVFKGKPVPILDDDGRVLWEGNSVARYLAARYGDGTLYPRDEFARADIQRWMDYQLSTVRVYIHPLLREDLSAGGVAEEARMLAESMAPLEATLARQPYLGGDHFTLADVPLGIVTFRWFVIDVPRPKMPNMEAWFDRLSARPAFQASVIKPVDTNVPLRESA